MVSAKNRWGFSMTSERNERFRPMFRLPKEEAEELELLKLKMKRKSIMEEF